MTEGVILPAAVRAGMARKISDSQRKKVDGEPATVGVSMEQEARYYFTRFLPHTDLSFDDYLSALSRELRVEVLDEPLTLDWIRACDRRGQIATARRDLARLRTTAAGARECRTGFWVRLWKLSEVYLARFGLTVAELETSPEEIRDISWRYLLRECEARIQFLKVLIRRPALTAARNLFNAIDAMLSGVPMASDDFSREWKTPYVSRGAYRAYSAATSARPIPPEAVGWSRLEHRRIESIVFPRGRHRDEKQRAPGIDPSAPAICEDIGATQPGPPDALHSPSSPGPIPQPRTLAECRSGFLEALARRILPPHAVLPA